MTETEVLKEHAYRLCYEKGTVPETKVAAATATVGSVKTQEKQVVVTETQLKNTKKEVGCKGTRRWIYTLQNRLSTTDSVKGRVHCHR